MNPLASYQKRRIFIKRIIFWALVIGGLLALLFFQTSIYTRANTTQRVDVCDGIGGCLPGIENNASNYTGVDGIVRFIIQVVYFLVFIGTAISVFFIVLGGWRMITSNGEDGYKKGLETVKNAVIGLVVAIFAITIVYIISAIVPNLNIFE